MGEYIKGLVILMIVLVITAVLDYILSAVFKNAGMFLKILIPAIFTTYSIFITSFVIAKSISLEYYSDYESALKEKEGFVYKLGQIIIKAHKNWHKGGYIMLWFEVKKLKKEFKKGK